MPAPYQPLAFANEFILKSEGAGVDHMKLQKLVYCAYGWWLAAHREPIMTEGPEVWRHGPVFSSLYSALAGNGARPITTPQSAAFGKEPPRIDDGDEEACNLVDFVWHRYGAFSGFKLSEMTHKKGTPWQITAKRNNYRVPRHLKIEDDLIRGEFSQLANEAIA